MLSLAPGNAEKNKYKLFLHSSSFSSAEIVGSVPYQDGEWRQRHHMGF